MNEDRRAEELGAEELGAGERTGADSKGWALISRLRLTHLSSTSHLAYYIGLVTVCLAVVFGLATYLILTGLTPIVPTHGIVVTVLAINVVLVLAMIAIVAWQLAGLWLARKRQTAGARLHFKIVSLFSVIAMLPAVILAIFASVSLDRGLDHWFSSRTKLVVQNSLDVANAYLQEHGQVIGTDIVAMSRDIDDAAELFKDRPKRFGGLLFSQSALRNLQAAYLLDTEGKVLVEARQQQDDTPYAASASRYLVQAAKGDVILIPPGRGNHVGALKKLSKIPDAYLYVVRNVNPRVMQQLRQTQARVVEYGQLEQRRTGVQVAFGLMYVAVALTLLLAAIWIGMWFANALVAPIRRLIAASLSVSQGDLETRVPVRSGEGDLSQLSITFNRMTSELKHQRDELVTTNSQLDERRRFTEAVLSGVTAGVLGLDANAHITLTNPSALALLGRNEEQLIGRPLGEAVPEFARLLEAADKQPRRERLSEHATLSVNGLERTFALQVTRERASAGRDQGIGGDGNGLVLTFDDITELVAAQRTSAWADVARRIAHEIKNPLTPIQLSAERLRRKYGASITEDREVFDRCTETIIRQVGDIGRMVDEFSSFARMPAPQMSEQDLRDIIRETAFLFQTSNSHIEIKVAVPKSEVVTLCDSRLLAQALTNMIKNATEAIATAAETAAKDANYKGRIKVGLQVVDNWIEISVIDNGIGLPKKDRQRLVEPYMTTREKGTGIGLAVVNRVVEQHAGLLRLEDAFDEDGTQRGAAVRLLLPVTRSGDASAKGNDAPASSTGADHRAKLAANAHSDGDSGLGSGTGSGVGSGVASEATANLNQPPPGSVSTSRRSNQQ